MDQDTLLSYLSYCSRSTGDSPIQLITGEEKMFEIVEDDLSTEIDSQRTCSVRLDTMEKRNGGSELLTQGLLEPKNIVVPRLASKLDVHDEADNYVMFILANIGEIWPLMKLGCISEVLWAMSSWKEELAAFITVPCQSFILQYLHVVKLLSKVWFHVMCPINLSCNEMGDMGYILEKLERRLRELRYRFIGLSKEEEMHILELILVTFTIRLSTFDACCHESTLKKLYSTKSRVEFLYKDSSSELSKFVIELIKLLQKTDTSIDGDEDIFQFNDLLEFFSLNQLVLRGSFKYMKAEVDVPDNDWLNSPSFCSRTSCWNTITNQATQHTS